MLGKIELLLFDRNQLCLGNDMFVIERTWLSILLCLVFYRTLVTSLVRSFKRMAMWVAFIVNLSFWRLGSMGLRGMGIIIRPLVKGFVHVGKNSGIFCFSSLYDEFCATGFCRLSSICNRKLSSSLLVDLVPCGLCMGFSCIFLLKKSFLSPHCNNVVAHLSLVSQIMVLC